MAKGKGGGGGQEKGLSLPNLRVTGMEWFNKIWVQAERRVTNWWIRTLPPSEAAGRKKGPTGPPPAPEPTEALCGQFEADGVKYSVQISPREYATEDQGWKFPFISLAASKGGKTTILVYFAKTAYEMRELSLWFLRLRPRAAGPSTVSASFLEEGRITQQLKKTPMANLFGV